MASQRQATVRSRRCGSWPRSWASSRVTTLWVVADRRRQPGLHLHVLVPRSDLVLRPALSPRRRTARTPRTTPDSDIDLVVVRPTDIDEDDEAWAESIEGWRRDVHRLTGNPVEVLEMSDDEAVSRFTGRSHL